MLLLCILRSTVFDIRGLQPSTSRSPLRRKHLPTRPNEAKLVMPRRKKNGKFSSDFPAPLKLKVCYKNQKYQDWQLAMIAAMEALEQRCLASVATTTCRLWCSCGRWLCSESFRIFPAQSSACCSSQGKESECGFSECCIVMLQNYWYRPIVQIQVRALNLEYAWGLAGQFNRVFLRTLSKKAMPSMPVCHALGFFLHTPPQKNTQRSTKVVMVELLHFGFLWPKRILFT